MIKKEANKGVAMIVVLAMLVIFAALIVAVVLSSTAAIRRAHFYQDRAVAVQIAQAGIQDALYWLNEKGYPSCNYPCTNLEDTSPYYLQYDGEYKYFQGLEAGTNTWTSATPTYNPSDIPGGSCIVEFEDKADSDQDTITATGEYKGRRAIVSVNLRGDNGYNHDHETKERWLRDFDGEFTGNATWGVPEAFNKHTIYAKNVALSDPGTITITGNITYEQLPGPDDFDESTNTNTFIDLPRFSPPSILTLPNPPATYNYIYDDAGSVDDGSGPLSVNGLIDGVYWDGIRYHFGVANDGLSLEEFDAEGWSILVDADVVIPNNGSSVIIDGYFKTTGDLEIKQGITTDTDGQHCFDVDGTLTIESGVAITGDLVARKTLTLNQNNINGDVRSTEDITITGGTIGGFVGSNGNITITGGEIGVSAYSDDAAVYLYNTTDLVIRLISISGFSVINVGDNQRAGILAYVPNGTGSITINNPLTFNYAGNPEQFAIVNNSNTASVNINADINGSIYSSGNITLNNTLTQKTITGMLVAGETVAIGNNSIIEYDPYIKRSKIYRGFEGGRRRYVPVPRSWKIKW